MDKSVFIKLLTSPSYQKHLPPIQDLSHLKTTQQKIQQHIQQLAELNQKYHKKQEQSFLIAFTGVMDKMTQELLKAKRKYEDVDTKIRRHQICAKLEKEIVFFKRDNAELRVQLGGVREEIKGLREKNEELKSTVEALKNTLKNKSINLNLNRARQKQTELSGQRDRSKLSRMSVCQFKQDEISISDFNKKTIAKNIDFKSQRRAESNLSRRVDNTVLKTRVLKQSSFEIRSLQKEITRLWREYKEEYIDYEEAKNKTKGKVMDGFISSLKIRKLIKMFIISSDNNL